jgi:NAD(P)H-nitrite reductase large subunit
VIIGITQAGLAAAETIRSLDRNASITVLSGDPFPVSIRRLVAAPLCQRIWSGTERPAFRGNDFFSRFDITTRSGIGVERIDSARRVVRLAGGSDVFWDRLLLATGNVTVVPAIPGGDTVGRVRYMSRLADTRSLGEELGRDRDAVIAGSGYLSVKAAESLAASSRSVSIVHPDRDVFSFIPDAEARRLAAAALGAGGVSSVPDERVMGITECPWRPGMDRGAVDWSAILSSGRNIPCGILVVIPDSRPDVRLAQMAGLTLNRGVMVNERMETSAAGVYAAGECAVVSELDGGVAPERMCMPCPDAVRQARVAAMHMVASVSGPGRPVDIPVYRSGTALVTFDFFGLLIHSCGIVNPPVGSFWEIRTDTGGSTVRKPRYRKFVLKGNRLAGCLLVNAPERCGYFKNSIERRRAIPEITGLPPAR